MYEKEKHIKVRYDKIGEPRDNKRVKAHVGDVIEIVGTTVRGRVIRITNSKKTTVYTYCKVGDGKYSDWFYKIRFENGHENWLRPGEAWRVVEDANKDKW